MSEKKKQHSLEYLLTVDGAALSAARVRAEISMDELAAKFQCSKGQISKWEQSKLQPSPERLWAMVDLFGTNNFVRLNGKAKLTDEEIEAVRRLRA